MLSFATRLRRIDRHAADRIRCRNIHDPVFLASLDFAHSLPVLIFLTALFIRAAMLYIECGIARDVKLYLRTWEGRCASSSRIPHILIIARLREGGSMTAVEVLFRYGMPPGENEMGALGQMSDVYGIRRLQCNERDRTVRVEYDATRLNESTVEKLLRSAGLDIEEKLALA